MYHLYLIILIILLMVLLQIKLINSELELFKNSKRNKGANLAVINYPSIKIDNYKPNEFKMYVHNISECAWISNSLLNRHEWEPILIFSLIKSLKLYNTMNDVKDTLFVDIGANIGTFSFTMASLNFNVISIEPLFYNTELYIETKKLNKFDNCKLFKVALTDIDKNESLCFIPFESTKRAGNLGNGKVENINNCLENKYLDSEIVKATTLDNLLNNNEIITAMKIDIEGHEYPALYGALQILQSNRAPCHIQFEYVHLRKSDDRNQLIHLLHKNNYQCQILFRNDWTNIYEKQNEEYSKGEYRCFHKLLDRCKVILNGHNIQIN